MRALSLEARYDCANSHQKKRIHFFFAAFILMEQIKQPSRFLAPRHKQSRKSKSSITLHGLLNPSRQQSGKHWNNVVGQLKDISSLGVNDGIQRISQ